ncbi:molybdenum cofactor guanylyltransferase MobA [soil metagenome]
MTGVVLSGGESRRMGNDKGLLMAENKNWAQAAHDKLAPFVNHVVVSVNPSQYEIYNQQFLVSQLVQDTDLTDIHGPLHGLLSVHLQYPGQDLFVLACDMIAMNAPVLTAIFVAYQEDSRKECYVCNSKNGLQPLAGIYTSALFERILLLRRNQQFEKFSMKYVLEISNTHIIPVQEAWEPYFVNCNFKENVNYQ